MKERVNYIDYLRAIGIVLMVLGHIPLSDAFVHYVHGFHMPLFFVISGYCYKAGGGTERLKKILKKLLIPYFSFSVAAYVLWFIEIQPQSLNDALKPIKAIFWVNSEGMPLAGALWFLTAMLVVNILVFCIEKIFDEKYKWIAIVGVFTFGLLETSVLPFRLPWSTGAACVGVGYFYFGSVMKRFWNGKIMTKLKSIQIWIYCAVLLCSGCIIMLNGIQNMRKGEYACIPLTVFNSIISVSALWLLIYRISPIADEKLGNIANEIKRIGQYSVIWLCCNELSINLVWSIMDKMRFHNLCIEVLVVFIALKICEKVFTETPLSVFVGFSYVKKRR